MMDLIHRQAESNLINCKQTVFNKYLWCFFLIDNSLEVTFSLKTSNYDYRTGCDIDGT